MWVRPSTHRSMKTDCASASVSRACGSKGVARGEIGSMLYPIPADIFSPEGSGSCSRIGHFLQACLPHGRR